MKITRRTVTFGGAAMLAAAGLPLAARTAAAQDAFPSKPIQILVGWSPGGGPSTLSDLISHIAAEEKLSPQPLVLEHKPGASGMIGNAIVAGKPGDPYIFMPAGGAMLLQTVTGESAVHPLNDLTPLGLSLTDSTVIVTTKNSKYKTFKDVVDQLKKEPRSITLGLAGGNGSWDVMTTSTLSAAAGIQFNEIPFDGGAEVQAAVLGGQVELASRTLANAIELIKSGDTIPLVVFDAQRNPMMPDVPTVKESGYDVVINLGRGWFGPKDLPQDAVDWYGAFFKKISESPKFIKFCADRGLNNAYMNPADYRVDVGNTMKKIEDIYRKVGIIK